jgi:hypothetical protein
VREPGRTADPSASVLRNNRLGDPSGGKRHALVVRQISPFLTSLAPWTGAPCSRFCVHGLNTTFFQCFHHRSTPTYRKIKWKASAHLVQPMYAKTRTWGTRPGGEAWWQTGKAEDERTAKPRNRAKPFIPLLTPRDDKGESTDFY